MVGQVFLTEREVLVGKQGLPMANLDDPESLGRSVVCLLRDRALRERMGAAGFDRLQRSFSFERFSRDLGTLLDRHLECAA